MRSVVGFQGPVELGGFAEGSFLAAEPPPRSFPVETGGAGVCASVWFTPQVSSELRASAAAIRVRRQSPGGFALCVSRLEKWVKSHVFWLKKDKILIFMCVSVHKRCIVASLPPTPAWAPQPRGQPRAVRAPRARRLLLFPCSLAQISNCWLLWQGCCPELQALNS